MKSVFLLFGEKKEKKKKEKKRKRKEIAYIYKEIF
jgi:hypothetical protein